MPGRHDPDPDTAFLRIRVLFRPPTFDPAADRTDTRLVRDHAAVPRGPELPLDLTLTWQDAADYRDIDVSPQLGAEGTITGPCPC